MAPFFRYECMLAFTLALAKGISYSSAFQVTQSRVCFQSQTKSDTISFLKASPLNFQTEENEINGNRDEIRSPSKTLLSFGSSVLLSMAIMTSSMPAMAVSGGGLDFAGLDISNQDFSNGNYKGKDFSQVIAKGTTFAKSNLIGCRFFKAYLVRLTKIIILCRVIFPDFNGEFQTNHTNSILKANSDFTGADLRGASLEDTSMDDAVFKGANLSGAYFSASLGDAKSIENADFTDAQLPPKLLERICTKDNFAFGTNPSTGVETRDSLMCP